MQLVRITLALTAGLIAAGCSSTPRQRPGGAANNAPGGAAPSNNIKPFWAKNDEPRPGAPPLNQPGPRDNGSVRPAGGQTTDYNGVIAGSLVDSFNRRVPRAFIQVALADGSGGRPIEMAVENGYFVIPGLTAGRSYMLTARTVDGERRLAGRLQVTPPNPRVVIRVSEDLYSGTVPPPPSGEGDSGPGPRFGRPIADPSAPASRGDEGNGWRPESAPRRGAGNDYPPAPPLDAPPSDPDRIPPMGMPLNAENIADRDRTKPAPIISIPNGGPPAPPLPDPDPPPMGGNRSGSSGPGAYRVPNQPQVPSCDFAGPNRLRNMALNDVYGQTWEFRQAQGKLILIDFWGTWCAPCMKAIPHIKRLHGDFGPYGLEVIGVACERTSGSERSRRVLDAIEKHQINYRVLLAEEYEQCPVQQKFRIDRYPTLVLMDRSGNVLWRGDSNGLTQLEGILKRDLRGGR